MPSSAAAATPVWNARPISSTTCWVATKSPASILMRYVPEARPSALNWTVWYPAAFMSPATRVATCLPSKSVAVMRTSAAAGKPYVTVVVGVEGVGVGSLAGRSFPAAQRTRCPRPKQWRRSVSPCPSGLAVRSCQDNRVLTSGGVGVRDRLARACSAVTESPKRMSGHHHWDRWKLMR